MKFQEIFTDVDGAQIGNPTPLEDADENKINDITDKAKQNVIASTTTENGKKTGELNSEEFKTFVEKLKEEILFKDGFKMATWEECMEQEEQYDDKNGDKNKLLDIDEALNCFQDLNTNDSKFSRCKVDTNQTGVL